MRGLSDERKGELGGILAAVFFGMMPLFTRFAYAGGSNPYMASFLRFFIAALILAGVAAATGWFTLRIRIGEIRRIFPPAVFLGLTAALLYPSYNYISTGLATTLHFTYPVWVMLLLLLSGDRLTKTQFASLILCMAGITMLHTPGEKGALLGVVLAVGSGVAIAVYTVLLAKMRPEGLSVLTVCFWTDLCAAVVTGISAAASGNFTLRLTAGGWFGSIMLAFTASVLAVMFYQVGVLYCGGLKTALLGALEPVTGVLIGMLVYQEKITAAIFAGVALILASAVLALRGKQEQPE